jgi:peptidoglycan/LPS O-acetylase OafA/YrhL
MRLVEVCPCIGVDIFFVISGLVIAYTANGNSPRRFAEGRFFRLMPSVWIASTISAIVLILASTVPWDSIFADYLRSMILSPKGPWIEGSYWTLTVEIVFYTVIFAILCQNMFAEIDKILGLAGVAVSTLAIVTLWLSPRYPILSVVLTSWPSKLFLLNNGSEFVLGVFLYLVLFIEATSFRLSVLAICLLGSCAQISHHILSFPFYSNGGVVMWLPLILWLAAGPTRAIQRFDHEPIQVCDAGSPANGAFDLSALLGSFSAGLGGHAAGLSVHAFSGTRTHRRRYRGVARRRRHPID